MIRVPDWTFAAAGQEMRAMGPDATSYHPGLYLTQAQVTGYILLSIAGISGHHKSPCYTRSTGFLSYHLKLWYLSIWHTDRSSGSTHSGTTEVPAEGCSY